MNSRNPTELDETEEVLARRVAKILGSGSAAAAAIAELDRRRAAGEDVALFQLPRRWVVGPPLGLPTDAL
jgi:hypothetical protein